MWNVSILSKLSTTMCLLANELQCSGKWALTLCGPHHLGLRGGWDLIHRSSLATMNMECFPTIPVGLILLTWPFSSSSMGEAVSKEHLIFGHFPFIFCVQPFCSLSLSGGTREEIQSRDPQSSSATGLQQFKPEEPEIANGAPKNTSSVFPEVALESGRDLRLNPGQANINKWHALVSSGSYTDNFEQCGQPLCLEPGEFMWICSFALYKYQAMSIILDISTEENQSCSAPPSTCVFVKELN